LDNELEWILKEAVLAEVARRDGGNHHRTAVRIASIPAKVTELLFANNKYD
jgi:uncharacterized protein (DUF2336 family)